MNQDKDERFLKNLNYLCALQDEYKKAGNTMNFSHRKIAEKHHIWRIPKALTEPFISKEITEESVFEYMKLVYAYYKEHQKSSNDNDNDTKYKNFLSVCRIMYINANNSMNFHLSNVTRQFKVRQVPKRILEPIISKDITDESVNEFKSNAYGHSNQVQQSIDFDAESDANVCTCTKSTNNPSTMRIGAEKFGNYKNYLSVLRIMYINANNTMSFSPYNVTRQFKVRQVPKSILEPIISKDITDESVYEFFDKANEYRLKMKNRNKEGTGQVDVGCDADHECVCDKAIIQEHDDRHIEDELENIEFGIREIKGMVSYIEAAISNIRSRRIKSNMQDKPLWSEWVSTMSN